MVAAVKLRRAQESIEATRPYAEKFNTILGHLIAQLQTPTHPLLETRAIQNVCLVSVSADRGLCGSFNSNVIRATAERLTHYQKGGVGVRLICVGRRSRDHFKRRNFEVAAEYVNIFQRLEFQAAINIVKEFEHLYIDKRIDKVEVIYNNFKTAILQTVLVEQLLPLTPKPPTGDAFFIDYLYEPSQEKIFQAILGKHLNMQMWKVLLDSNAAEQAARMAAMENATRNAKDLIEELTRQRNRARQTMITKEISEIVGGAEALG
jgi:F-type H+-transporting ATPase subunit gamma